MSLPTRGWEVKMCRKEGGPLYKPYRYVPLQRVKFWRRFGLESDMVFEETTGTYESIYRFNWKERKSNMRIQNGF